MANHDIQIKVKTTYLPGQSDPKAKRFVFAYTIHIKNAGGEPAKLLRRHWKIVDGNNLQEEVRGDGVIGEQPRLAPGGEFTYSSGAILKTPTGTMEGSYTFRTDDGRTFEAPIALFVLAVPGALH